MATALGCVEPTGNAAGCSEASVVRPGPAQPVPYPAEKARGGKILLRRPWQQIVFVAGLLAPLVLLLILYILSR
jgi:hypothetical protein